MKTKAANPAVLLLILSVFYILLLVAVTIMEAAEMEGLELRRLSVDAANPERTLGYVVAGGLSVLLVFTFYFFLALFRIMVRKAAQTDLYSRKNAPANSFTCYKKNPHVDIMTAYILISFILCAIWSGVAFWATSKPHVLIGGLIGPLVIAFYGRGFVYFALNDFDYFQNVKKLNLAIDKHNENIASMETKKAAIQQQLLDGTLMLPSLAPASPEGQQQEDDPEMNKPGLPVPAVVEEPDQNAAVQAMVEAERRKAEEASERRRVELEGNAALQAEEGERRKQMAEQLKLEKEEKARQAKIAEERRRKDMEAKAKE